MTVETTSALPFPDPITVGELRANMDALDAAGRESGVPSEWRVRRREQLSGYPDDFSLVTLQEVAYSERIERLPLTAHQREAILWQHRKNVNLGDFAYALWEAVGLADDTNLGRLAVAYPEKVAAVRMWRYDREFVRRLRAMPFKFSL